MKPILVLLASKGRPKKIEGFYRTWRQTTSGLSEVLVCLDDNDPTLKEYIRHRDIHFDVGPGLSTCEKYNRVFQLYPNYKYYFIPGDDHRIRTKGWEKKFIKAIKENGGNGVAFGNDLLQGKKLATAPFVSGNIFRAIGYLAIPGLIHMFVDNFWTELGKKGPGLLYFDDIIIEHMHFSVGKSKEDKWYLAVNNKKVFKNDEVIFQKWRNTKLKYDLKKIQRYKDGMPINFDESIRELLTRKTTPETIFTRIMALLNKY